MILCVKLINDTTLYCEQTEEDLKNSNDRVLMVTFPMEENVNDEETDLVLFPWAFDSKEFSIPINKSAIVTSYEVDEVQGQWYEYVVDQFLQSLENDNEESEEIEEFPNTCSHPSWKN